MSIEQAQRVMPERGALEQLRGSPFPPWLGDNVAGGGALFCALHDGGVGRYLNARECFSHPAAKEAQPATQRRCVQCAHAPASAPAALMPTLIECYRVYEDGLLMDARRRAWEASRYDGAAAASRAQQLGHGAPLPPSAAEASLQLARTRLRLLERRLPEGVCTRPLKARLVAWRRDVAGEVMGLGSSALGQHEK